jgi:Bacterial Ig domain
MRRFSFAAVLVVTACQAADFEEVDLSLPGDAIETFEDVPVTFDVGASDATLSTPAHGVIIGKAPRFIYVPDADFSGTDSVTITVGETQTTRDIMVAPINDAPLMGDDVATTDEDVALEVKPGDLLANDADPDDDALTLVSVGNPRHGTVVSDGVMVRFLPAADYHGPASFDYVASDGMTQITARVAITVTAVDDAPEGVDDEVATAEDVPAFVPVGALTANDRDPDGVAALTVLSLSSPVHGDVALAGGVVVFTPAPDFHGEARFTYTVGDGTASDTADVVVVVGAIDDEPTATVDFETTAEDIPLVLGAASFLGNDSDVDSQLEVVGVRHASFGEARLVGPLVVFTPETDFHGIATFEYVVSDGFHETSALVVVSVTPVDDQAIAVDDGLAGSEDAPLSVAIADLLGNDHDVDGEPSFGALGAATHGSAAIVGDSIVFTPEANYVGAATFGYTLADGGSATVYIELVGTNDAPVAISQASSSTHGAPVALVLSATDDDSTALGYEITTMPEHGTLEGSPPSITYTPEDGYQGSDSFGFRATDGQIVSNEAVVSIDVTAPLAYATVAPVRVGDGCTMVAGTPIAASRTGRVTAAFVCDGSASVATSVDRGATYPAPQSLGSGDPDALAVAAGPAGYAYVVTLTDGEVTLSRTVDGGATWQAPVGLGTADGTPSVVARGNQVWVSAHGSEGIWIARSFDRGGSFATTTIAGPTRQALLVEPTGSLIVATETGDSVLFAASQDDGASFGAPFAGAGSDQADAHFARGGGYLFVTGGYGQLSRTPVSNPNWSVVYSWFPVDIELVVAADEAAHAYVAYVGGGALEVAQVDLEDHMEIRALGESPSAVGLGALPGAVPGTAVLFRDGGEVYATVQTY